MIRVYGAFFCPPLQATLRFALCAATSLMLAACATVPKEDRLLTSLPDGNQAPTRGGTQGFDRGALRVLSWNIHKAQHAGLARDFAGLAAKNDLLLLQEAVHSTPVCEQIERAGFSWQMADAFAVGGRRRGVMIAARVAPVGGRALRTREPLFPLPKSAIVTRYRLADRRETLAVANLHGINFSLGLGRFREQLDAVADELRHHDGPMIFGGDFNTWSLRRHEALGEVTKQLGLTAVTPLPDERRRAFRRHLDHLFVRGFSVQDAQSPEVKSSDHNPILVRMFAERAGS